MDYAGRKWARKGPLKPSWYEDARESSEELNRASNGDFGGRVFVVIRRQVLQGTTMSQDQSEGLP